MSAAGMPPHLLGLFASRPALEFLPPPPRRSSVPKSGISAYGSHFEEKAPPPPEKFETPKERRARIKQEKLKEHELKLKELVDGYDPTKLESGTKDPYTTLFVGRLSFETTEKKLKKEFEEFGHIKRIRIIHDREGKPRGYAFIEFDEERQMKEAYKTADGKKIDGRRVLVDVERGRTVSGWLPRRLGGGRGPPRRGIPKIAASQQNLSIHRESTNMAPGASRPSQLGGGRPSGGGAQYRDGPPRSRDNFQSRDNFRPGGGRYSGGREPPSTGNQRFDRFGGPRQANSPPRLDNVKTEFGTRASPPPKESGSSSFYRTSMTDGYRKRSRSRCREESRRRSRERSRR